jgi:hypothetical protein
MPAVMAGRRLPDAVHAGDDRAGEHVHDRAARLSGRLSLNGDVAAAAADVIVDPGRRRSMRYQRSPLQA